MFALVSFFPLFLMEWWWFLFMWKKDSFLRNFQDEMIFIFFLPRFFDKNSRVEKAREGRDWDSDGTRFLLGGSFFKETKVWGGYFSKNQFRGPWRRKSPDSPPPNPLTSPLPLTNVMFLDSVWPYFTRAFRELLGVCDPETWSNASIIEDQFSRHQNHRISRFDWSVFFTFCVILIFNA